MNFLFKSRHVSSILSLTLCIFKSLDYPKALAESCLMIPTTILQHDHFHLHNWNYIKYAGSRSPPAVSAACFL